jgi:hypothetical protein
MIVAGVLTEEEVRAQWIADGLISVPISEKIPPEAQAMIDLKTQGTQNLLDAKTKRNPDTSDVIGDPVAPDKGGWGDLKQEKAKLDDTVLLDSLDMAFKSSFDKMLSKDLESRITRLVWKAAKIFFPQALTVGKSLTREEVLIWGEWFDETLFGEPTEDTPEVVTKALTNYMTEMESELEQEEDWWMLELAVGTLAALYAMAYESGLKYSASDMARHLYFRGLLSYPDLTQPFSVATNKSIQDELTRMAEETLANVNNGTKFYLSRIVLSKVKEAFTTEEVLSKIMDGATVENILSDVIFTKGLVSDILGELNLVMNSRVEVISEFELDKITNKAIVDEYNKVGLTKKAWECYGKNPCNHCQENRKAGFVPLSFVYVSPMGGVLRPTAHPHCECGLKYDGGELASLATEGKFNIWYGD